MDEFIVDRGRVPRLCEFQKKIERMYEVKIGFEDVPKAHQQWVMVQGENMDRQNAKEYILALCDPRETQTLNYKGCQALFNSETIEHIEKQTNAVIIIEGSSAVTITGTDLGVTLAMSSLEELLGKYDTEMDGTEGVTDEKDTTADDSVSPWSLRLDTTLQRALSQQSDGNSSMTIEDYDNTSASVKRVILQCLNDTATDDIDDDLLFVSNSPKNSQKSSNQFKLPLLMGDEQADSASDGQHKKQGSDTEYNQIDGRVGNLTQQLTGANISHTEANCAAKPSGALPNSKLSKELEYLRSFGMSVGYSVNIVEEGLKFADENTQVSDFIEILTRISDSKSEDSSDKGNRSSSPDLEILSPSKNLGNFPPPPPIPSPSKLADMTGRRSLPPEYKSKLIKDFTEEENDLPIEELKRRNEERQSVLQASFDDENLPKRNTNMSPRGQNRGEKNGHHSTKQKGQGRSQNKKNKQKGRQPGAETPTQYIEIDDSEETCVMEPWKDDVDDDCRIVDISHSNSMPVVVQPNRQQQQQHTNYNRQSYQNNFQQPYGALSSPQRQQTSTGHHQQLQKGPIAGKPDDLRYIVIDGSNVAMTHGNGKIFSCRGIKICIDHFLKRGHKQVTAFVPEWRKYRPRMENLISDQPLLEQLREQGYLVFTPSRRVNGKLISAYDDRFVLELAEREDGVVVSNDQYRDLMKEKASWRILVEDRLLMFTFAGDNFMIPEDPLGQDGPTLDQLLHKPHAGAQKRPLSPDKSDRGNFRQQHQNNWTNMPRMTLAVGNARFPYQNLPQRGLNPNLGYQKPPLLQQFPGQFQFRQNQPGDAAVFRGAHRGRGQRYPQPQPKKFTALSSRSDQSTEELFTQLKGIFSESKQEQKIREVLQNHQEETDLNRLTNYCMNAIFQ
ncbi:NEDD4-binding protein 1-like [Pecten maximus]|uniref:NEDD4-binding protein 1-like n=1 Tax=Pecten maximus TaxID=6579 RepID=UPI001458C8FE|nr:NEDD4-binding protein 1-like [Pecten maximus]